MGSATSLVYDSPDARGTLNTLEPVIELPAGGAQRHSHHCEQLGLDQQTNSSRSSDGDIVVHYGDYCRHTDDHQGGGGTTRIAVEKQGEQQQQQQQQQHQQQQQPRLWLPAPITPTKRPKVRIIEPHSRSPFLPKSPLMHLHRHSPLAHVERRTGNKFLEGSDVRGGGVTNLSDPMRSASPIPSFGFDCVELIHDAFGEEEEQ